MGTAKLDFFYLALKFSFLRPRKIERSGEVRLKRGRGEFERCFESFPAWDSFVLLVRSNLQSNNSRLIDGYGRGDNELIQFVCFQLAGKSSERNNLFFCVEIN